MNKYLILFLLPLLSFTMIGCDEEDDVKPMDLTLFPGTWEVVDNGNQELLVRDCLLDIKSSQIQDGYGGYQGYITTYYLTESGTTIHDRVFSWSIREVESHHPLLNIVFQGELDSDNIWDGNYPYKITKLDYNNMWWQVYSNGDNSIIKFRRRNDIQIE